MFSEQASRILPERGQPAGVENGWESEKTPPNCRACSPLRRIEGKLSVERGCLRKQCNTAPWVSRRCASHASHTERPTTLVSNRKDIELGEHTSSLQRDPTSSSNPSSTTSALLAAIATSLPARLYNLPDACPCPQHTGEPVVMCMWSKSQRCQRGTITHHVSSKDATGCYRGGHGRHRRCCETELSHCARGRYLDLCALLIVEPGFRHFRSVRTLSDLGWWDTSVHNPISPTPAMTGLVAEGIIL